MRECTLHTQEKEGRKNRVQKSSIWLSVNGRRTTHGQLILFSVVSMVMVESVAYETLVQFPISFVIQLT